MVGKALYTGFIFGIVSLLLGLNGWDISRIWLYMLASAMLTMTGIQLLIYWIQLRVLDELSQRDSLVVRDLQSPESADK